MTQLRLATLKFILAGLGNWYLGWEMVMEAVIKAEELGFWGFVMPDHYMWASIPEHYKQAAAAGANSTLDAWIALTYLSTLTDSIHIGTLVTPIPLRPPALLAKTVSTLDVLSRGRVILGIGAGWSRTEFEGYAEWHEPKLRIDMTEEGVQLIIRLWTEKSIDFKGRFYHARGAVLDPKPLQKPHPPLLFGGAGRRMLRLAGRYGDICFIPPWAKLGLEEARSIALGEARRTGREGKPSFALGSPSNTPEYLGLRYDYERYLSKVEEAERNSCDYFITSFPLDTYIDSMKNFSRDIIHSFSE